MRIKTARSSRSRSRSTISSATSRPAWATCCKCSQHSKVRSQIQIFQDLLVTGADVIRLRLADAELADASVPLDEGATFIQKAKDMVLAAACAAVNPRIYYPSRKPAQAMDYIRRARLGQTEPGSFIITIISPVPPSLAGPNGQLFELAEPYERRVTQMLAGALNSVRQAAEDAATTGKVDSFVRAVPSGVSANLCDAVAGMGSFTEGGRRSTSSFHGHAIARSLPKRRCRAGFSSIQTSSPSFARLPSTSRNRALGKSLKSGAPW